MKKKKLGIMVAVSVLVLLVVITGVFIGIRLHNTDDTVTRDANKDLLVGVFVTMNPVEEEVVDDDTEHYATLVENTVVSETGEECTEYTYVFEDLEGYSFFSFYYDDGEKNFWSSVCDDVFSSASVQIGEERVLTANLIHSLYDMNVAFHPVYQKKDGRVYTVLDEFGLVHGIGTPGFSVEEKFSDVAIRFNKGEFEKISTYIHINLDGRSAVPETIEYKEMNNDGRCIDTVTYTAEEFPDVIWPSEDTDYVLVSTVYDDGEDGKYSEREIVGKDDESFYTFSLDENRIFREKITEIKW